MAVMYTVVHKKTRHFYFGENFNKFLFRNSFLNIVVKKLWKSVNICQSYRKN